MFFLLSYNLFMIAKMYNISSYVLYLINWNKSELWVWWHYSFFSRVNCSFYFKIGACRHGDRCSRLHNKPTFSQVRIPPKFSSWNNGFIFSSFSLNTHTTLMAAELACKALVYPSGALEGQCLAQGTGAGDRTTNPAMSGWPRHSHRNILFSGLLRHTPLHFLFSISNLLDVARSI